MNYFSRFTTIVISGDADQLQELQAAAAGINDDGDKKVPFSFQSLYPTPPALLNGFDTEEKRVAEFGFKSAQEWRLAHWGCRHDVEWCTEEKRENVWEIYFCTYNLFPDDGLVEISKRFEKLTFECVLMPSAENLVHGIATIHNGEYIDGGWWPEEDGLFEDELDNWDDDMFFPREDTRTAEEKASEFGYDADDDEPF